MKWPKRHFKKWLHIQTRFPEQTQTVSLLTLINNWDLTLLPLLFDFTVKSIYFLMKAAHSCHSWKMVAICSLNGHWDGYNTKKNQNINVNNIFVFIFFLVWLYPCIRDTLWKHSRQSLFLGYQLVVANKKGMEPQSKSAGQAQSRKSLLNCERMKQATHFRCHQRFPVNLLFSQETPCSTISHTSAERKK